MGSAQKPLNVKLFVAVLFDSALRVDGITDALVQTYGPIDSVYGPIAFSFSNYYADEMGASLMKWYAAFSRPFKRDNLPAAKTFTNDLERQFLVDGKRRFNIDPGYVAPDKLVLASTKDFYHRLYLGDGIYGEVTLHFRKGMFRFFSWTYPDYKEPAFLDFLTKSRARYMNELRQPE